MTEQEIYSQLEAIFRENFMRDDIKINPGMTAKDLEGWDSFKHIELLLLVQEHFRIKFSAREMDSLQCVGDLANAIVLKTAARGS